MEPSTYIESCVTLNCPRYDCLDSNILHQRGLMEATHTRTVGLSFPHPNEIAVS
jgi:hypothetical protein